MAATDAFLARALVLIRKFCQDTIDAVRWEDDDIAQLIDTANADVWEEILACTEPNTLAHLMEADVNIVVGQSDYDYPPNFRRMLALVHKDTDGNPDKEIMPVSLNGRRGGAILMEQGFRLHPIPAEADTFVMQYVPSVPEHLFYGPITGSEDATVSFDTATLGTVSPADDFYNGAIVRVLTGAGAGQKRLVSDYAGATQKATLKTAWTVKPSLGDVVEIMPCVAPPFDKAIMWRVVMEIKTSDSDLAALNAATGAYRSLMRQVLQRVADRSERIGPAFHEDGLDADSWASHILGEVY